MIRRFIVMLLLAGVVLGGIFGWKQFSAYQARSGLAAMGMPVVTVSTAEARRARWTPTIPAIGSLRALQGVDVTAQLAGQVTELYFESGDTVAKGALLVRQYTADDEAQLAGLVADTRLAELNLNRAAELVAKDLSSDTEYDTRAADLERARAAESKLRLVIAQKSIRVPFAGRLGIRKINVGQYIEPGDAIVRLESFDQMLVTFPVSQRHLRQLDVGQSINVTTDAWPAEKFSGRIRAIEPQVDRETRMVSIEGAIGNPDRRLVPGMFVKIAIALPIREEVITVPQSAVTYSPYGDSVYVVNDREDGQPTVRNTFVVTGETRGDQVAITSGLASGATVVTAGQQKLRNGAAVRIDNSVAVGNAPDPAPANN